MGRLSLYCVQVYDNFSCAREDVLKTNRIKLVVLSATVAAGVSTAFAANAYINQVGYRPSDPKQFSLVGASGNVEIVNASGQTALSVTPGAASYWDASGQNVQLVDFSELKTAGKYSIKVGGQVLRQDLVVKDNTFEDVLKAAAKWFYYQRASMALESQYARSSRRRKPLTPRLQTARRLLKRRSFASAYTASLCPSLWMKRRSAR